MDKKVETIINIQKVMQRKYVIIILLIYLIVQFIPIFQVAMDYAVYGFIYLVGVENRWLILIYELALAFLSLFFFNRAKVQLAQLFFLLLSIFYIKSSLSVLSDSFLPFLNDPMFFSTKEYWIEPFLLIIVVLASRIIVPKNQKNI